MPDFKVNAEIKSTQVDHAVAKALRGLTDDANRFQDTITIFHRWLNQYNLGIGQDINGEWLFYSHSNIMPEKRYDTFQQMLAGVLEELSARLPKVE